jgi:hypothetical protein
VTKEKEVDTIPALEAKLKHAKGLDLTRAEESLIKKYDLKVAIQNRDDFLLACTKQVYCKLADRHRSVVDEHARTYKIPADRPMIDLYQVLKRFHEIISEWGPVIRQLEGEEGALRIEKARMENELLRKKITAADLDIKSKQDEYISRDNLRIRMEWLGNRLRSLSERLGKRFGGEAQVIFNLELARIDEEMQ